MSKIMYKLQYQRKRKGFSQEVMASKLGMSVHGYRKYEQGKRKISIDTAIKIIGILEINQIEEILDVVS